MSWVQKLAETYDNCESWVGKEGEKGTRPLLPICHVTQQAHIEIVIDGEGGFRRAHLITDKHDATTIIPSTEASASRAGSKPENHPLCDKLQYVAGDYTEYGGSVTSGFSKDPKEPYRNFVETLTKWCDSKYRHPKARAVLQYVKRRSVMRDLVKHQILVVDTNGKLLDREDAKRDKSEKDIFSAVDRQDNAFVRWVVEIPGESETRVWRDKTLWQSWTKYYLADKRATSLCYVTGENQIITNNQPKYVRREGDGAKLISANDTDGFTFRGRFTKDDQACSVGLETSHKSHYALSWLISKQGFKKNELAIVAWATSGAAIPQPTDDPLSILGIDDLPTDEKPGVSTAQNVALRLKKKIAGYGKEIGDITDVVVMGLDSATPGRLAITFYRELAGSDFLKRVDDWHESCAWLHIYRFIEIRDEKSDKPKKKYIPFYGAPAPADIAEAAYGSRLDDKLRKATITRLLPCIVDGQPIPRDLVESAVRRASNRMGMSKYDSGKTLSIACALFRKHNRKEEYEMTLDPNRKTRDYLYGRLLALGESLEEWALNEAGEHRPTSAARLMQRFSERPYSTWRTIELALTPYKARLGGKSKKRQRMIDEVVASFSESDFTSDRRLSGEFLLGYHSQREFLRPASDEPDNDVNSESTQNTNS
jgi:CRISPR-associated protein Csd1